MTAVLSDSIPISLLLGNNVFETLGPSPEAHDDNHGVTWEGHHSSIFVLTEEKESTKGLRVLSALRL
jgi:hypothetical protein